MRQNVMMVHQLINFVFENFFYFCSVNFFFFVKICPLNNNTVKITNQIHYLMPRDPRGRSDCVENALEVTLTTDSISESPKSPIKSLSGDRE